LKLKRGGPSRFWAFLFRAKLVRARMPFWRVVVEAKLDRRVRRWPERYDAAVTAVFVWARTIEEAEGIAALALEAEGLAVMTADAKKCAPAAPPRQTPMAASRTELGFLDRADHQGAKPSRSRA
jgi:hypothetical protein